MNFQTAVKTCFQKYATFSGRAHRPEFWWFVLFSFIASIAFTALDFMMFDTATAEIGVFSTLFQLAILLPSLAVGARRLHDIGKSGWWQLIMLIPLIGIIVLIWWWCRPAQAAGAKYGPTDADTVTQDDPAPAPYPQEETVVRPSERTDAQPPV
ncbi:DUF805 domain-containing protein [Paracoccaceae bacterium GXU_MW_L88]